MSVENMILYIENPEEGKKERKKEEKKEGKKERKPSKIARTLVKFSGVSRYRINMQKLVAFYTLATSY